MVKALAEGRPADGGPPAPPASVRLNQVVKRVQLVPNGVAVHAEGQVVPDSRKKGISKLGGKCVQLVLVDVHGGNPTTRLPVYL